MQLQWNIKVVSCNTYQLIDKVQEPGSMRD